MNRREHKPENLKTTLEVGVEYYYWDKVVGRIDEGLCEVISIDNDNDKVKILNLYSNQEETLPMSPLDWEQNENQPEHSNVLTD